MRTNSYCAVARLKAENNWARMGLCGTGTTPQPPKLKRPVVLKQLPCRHCGSVFQQWKQWDRFSSVECRVSYFSEAHARNASALLCAEQDWWALPAAERSLADHWEWVASRLTWLVGARYPIGAEWVKGELAKLPLKTSSAR